MLFESVSRRASLRIKTSNRASFRASSSRPVAVERLDVPHWNISFYPQILLQTRISERTGAKPRAEVIAPFDKLLLQIIGVAIEKWPGDISQFN